MGSLERRLESLEARTPTWPRGRPGHVTGAEIRALETQIRLLEAGADEALTSPEATAAKRKEPDEETAAVLREIERLERIEQAPEGSTRWT